MDNKLTIKQERYCLNLIQGMSQREAYIQAGYSARAKPDVLDIKACELAKSGKVAVRLAELRRQVEDAAISTAQERRQILTQIERAKISDYVDEYGNLDVKKSQLSTAAVQEIKTERTLMGVKTTLKLRDPVAAIQEHNKMDGIYTVTETHAQVTQIIINMPGSQPPELITN